MKDKKEVIQSVDNKPSMVAAEVKEKGAVNTPTVGFDYDSAYVFHEPPEMKELIKKSQPKQAKKSQKRYKK